MAVVAVVPAPHHRLSRVVVVVVVAVVVAMTLTRHLVMGLFWYGILPSRANRR